MSELTYTFHFISGGGDVTVDEGISDRCKPAIRNKVRKLDDKSVFTILFPAVFHKEIFAYL